MTPMPAGTPAGSRARSVTVTMDSPRSEGGSATGGLDHARASTLPDEAMAARWRRRGPAVAARGAASGVAPDHRRPLLHGAPGKRHEGHRKDDDADHDR